MLNVALHFLTVAVKIMVYTTSPKSRQFRIISHSDVDIQRKASTIETPQGSGTATVFASQVRSLILGDDELRFDYERWRKGGMTGSEFFFILRMFLNLRMPLFISRMYLNGG